MKNLFLTSMLLISCGIAHGMDRDTYDSCDDSILLSALEESESQKEESQIILKEEESQDPYQEKTVLVVSKKETPQIPLAKFPQALFSPWIQEVLIKFIHDEEQQIRGALYRFTLQRPADAIVNKLVNKKIAAQIIVDEENITKDFCTPLRSIIEHGGAVYKKTKMRNRSNPGFYENMHHKFIIFDKNISGKKLLWTGSFNVTGQANLKNCENVVILDEPEIIAQFEQEFATCIFLCTKLAASECVSKKDTDTDSKINFARSMNGIPKLALPSSTPSSDELKRKIPNPEQKQ